MRPLDFPQDLWWYEIDKVSYDAEFDRKSQEHAQQFAAHMAGFKQQPKPTMNELKAAIQSQKDRVQAAHRLNLPPILMEDMQSQLDELTRQWDQGEYCKTAKDHTYRSNYYAQSLKFKFNFEPRIPQHVRDEIDKRQAEEEIHG